MSTSISEYVEKLRDLPHDLSAIPSPDLSTPQDQTRLLQALKDLEIEGSAEGRHTLLQAAALLPPDKYWENAVRDWAGHDEWLDGANLRVERWIAEGLRNGDFGDKAKWVERGLRDYREGHRMKSVIVRYGGIDIDHLLDILIDLFGDPLNRIPIVTYLLAVLVERTYSPGTPASSTIMYAIVQHKFLQSLLRSLMYDTGNHLFPKTIRLMLAIVPYAPLTLNPQVPFLMIVTGRAICWRDRKFVDEGDPRRDAVTRTPLASNEIEWTTAKSAGEEPIEVTIVTTDKRCVQLWLVAMYGAWPSNVLAFVRDPVSYLLNKSISSIYAVDWPEVYPAGLLAQRTAPLLKEFSLHPSLIYFTSAAELQDAKRWERNDPSEWLARAQMIAHMEITAGGMFSFMDASPEGPSAEDIVDMTIPSGAGTPGGYNILGNEDETDIERLRRENESLRVEAKLTDRVRKQFLYHIGRLHGYTLKFNTEESEMNSFVNRLKEQEKTIKSLTSELTAHRAEASAAQQKHLKWQAQLRDKNNDLREKHKAASGQLDRLRGELGDITEVVKKQKDELAVVKNERFKLQSQLTEIEPKIRHIEDYEVRMKQFLDMQRLWDTDVRRVKEAEAELEAMRGRFYQFDQILKACEKEKEQQIQIIRRLQTAVALREESRPPSPPPRAPPRQPDMSFYMNIAEEAKKRTLRVEKENRALREELETLKEEMKRESQPEKEERSFMWADEERSFPY